MDDRWVAIGFVVLLAVLVVALKLLIHGDVEGWWDDNDF